MKVLIINIDSKIPNLALKKIEKYHIDNGDDVVWDFPLLANQMDKIYVSCIFTKNKHLCREWEGRAEIGGSGYDLKKQLPEYIEKIKPRINWGFTTRGCIRKCVYCIVPEKEGKIRIVGDVYDIWDGTTKEMIIMDNNILALPKHFKNICSQLKKEKIKIDFNQGLDIRLLNKDIAKELKLLSHKEYHFAFDNLKDEKYVKKGIELLKSVGINRSIFYVLVGFDTTFEEDMYRVELLKKYTQNAYIQRYETIYNEKKYIQLAQWVNQHALYHTHTFKEFLILRNEKFGEYAI